MWLKWAYRHPRVTQMAGLICTQGRHSLAAVAICRCSGYTLVSLCFSALHKWLVSVYDSRYGMSDVPFHTTPQIGGPSCLTIMSVLVLGIIFSKNSSFGFG